MTSQLTNSDEQATQVATKWLAALSSATEAEVFASLFLPTGWLRDLMCFSWDFTSVAGCERIVEFLSAPSSDSVGKSRFENAKLHNFELDKSILPGKFPVPGNPQLEGVSTAFTFSITAPPATGRGFVRLLPDGEEGQWKASTVLTNIQDLDGHEEPKDGIEGYSYFGTTWEEEFTRKMAEIEIDPTVLIATEIVWGWRSSGRFNFLNR
ncbi:hypothetical protein FB45DRAFT_871459 [Roridomyces roridus]|uniref:Uncharacterized protein n=1 Tax=Roridomyces roridus TaxID=1738132 RepID=A0AAD7BGZ1_9AGAR|nr:hypothetical protein FB45DRAFT_871459 [Roridomyces roridus]